MGAKYEVRWKINGKCPCWNIRFTDSLAKVLFFYAKAALFGNTRVEPIMHDFKECPTRCIGRGSICPEDGR